MSDIRTALRTLVLSTQMVEWFRAHYTPSDSGEYDAREELEGNFGYQLEAFGDEGREEILDSVTMELEETGDLSWEMIDPADVRLLRAHDHEWASATCTALRQTSARPHAGESSRLVPAISNGEPPTPSPAKRAWP
jgi:hypothetical protein